MSPMEPAICANAGIAACTSGLLATSMCRVSAPMTILSPSRFTPRSSAMPERSTTELGLFSRCFSAGSRVWPPEIGRASGSAARIFTASATDEGL